MDLIPAEVAPTRTGALAFPYIEVSLFMRSSLFEMFKAVQAAGGTVTFQNEYRTFWKSTFVEVEFKGSVQLLRGVQQYFNQNR